MRTTAAITINVDPIVVTFIFISIYNAILCIVVATITGKEICK